MRPVDTSLGKRLCHMVAYTNDTSPLPSHSRQIATPVEGTDIHNGSPGNPTIEVVVEVSEPLTKQSNSKERESRVDTSEVEG